MNAIWVGEIGGNALVYDPAIQLPDCPHVFLWRPSEQEMGKYIGDLARKRIRPYTNRAQAAAYIAGYQAWRDSHGWEWLANERRYYESQKTKEEADEQERLECECRRAEVERIANLALEARHKERLAKIGKEYLGVRTATKSSLRRRITQCYSCKRSLDNSTDIECVVCDWILCVCGACGCGYSGNA